MSARHVMILASAGSGKTYALTSRFVELLARGARPERIVALTFTRKAAGEFFDEILKKLARAAQEPAFAAELAREIGATATTADFLRMLRDVVESMHLLRLGTLDGFFARIARAFPLELGLTGEFEVLEEHAGAIERRRVLQRMFAHAPRGLDDAQKEFIEAFKRATFGAEEKRLGAHLDTFLDAHQETFLAAGEGAAWGEAARVWPEGCVWLRPPGKALAAVVESLRALLAQRGLPAGQQGRWEAFFAALPEWTPGADLPPPVEYLLKNILSVWPHVRRGGAEITVDRKKLALGPAECAEVAALVHHLMHAEFTRHLEATRGIHAVLDGYESVYDEVVRRAGRLTFGDVQRLLLPDRAPVARMAIDYRVDGKFDHWLLDEFQDTSFGQWSVLRDLIDEAVQDPAGERTFFCVGDVKQAIFTWREGDPRLFGEIHAHYNAAAPGTIALRHLVQSYRSGPAIIETVNAIFGRADVFARMFPGTAGETWNNTWREHESAQPRLGGHVAWLHADDDLARAETTLRLLQEIAPLERGLTCAVLTQSNAEATALADFLRREGGIPALAESDLHVATDNPLGAALLALAQAAAHPGDTLAQEHWRATPLRDVLKAEGIENPETLTLRFLGQVHADGFERTLDFWLQRAERKLAAGDAFSRERARQFVTAAALFDATGSRDVAEFVAFMEKHVVRDAEASGAVRVMTIHKSKGLGFDVVVLPDLEGQRIDQRREGLAVQRTPERQVEWVLELPSKVFYAQDETLSAHVQAAEAEAGYEAIALLYVACTRAKRAMYFVTKAVGKSESRNYPQILASTLGAGSEPQRIGAFTQPGGYFRGDPDWHTRITPPRRAKRGAHEQLALDFTAPIRAPRRPSRRPSATRNGLVDASSLFELEAGAAAQFGRDVHALLAEVEWLGPAGADIFEQAWRKRGLAAEAVEAALACLRAPTLADLWRAPPHARVWRERAFEIVIEGAWVTGVFDRVVIERDARGQAQRVRVFDFKTERVADETALREAVAQHAAQLNTYRRVVAALTCVDVRVVECELVFTRLTRRMAVQP